jgi:hypothetical protein
MLLNPKDIPLSEMPFIGSIETVLCHLLFDAVNSIRRFWKLSLLIATGLLSP